MKKLILVLAVLFTVSFAQAQAIGNTAVKTEKTAQVQTTPANKTTRTVHHRKHPKDKKIAKKGTKAAVHHRKHAKKNKHEANQE